MLTRHMVKLNWKLNVVQTIKVEWIMGYFIFLEPLIKPVQGRNDIFIRVLCFGGKYHFYF